MSEILSMPAEQYFAAEGLSSSSLNLLIDECPAKLKGKMGQPSEESDALEFGTLFHRYVLEPETLENAFHIKPEGMSFTTTDGKAWKKAHLDRPIVKEEDVKATRGMVASLRANSDFMHIFQRGDSERSLFARDEQGTLRKGRIDFLPRQGANYLLDLKSCQSAKPALFETAVDKYRYYRKAAYYLDLCRLCGMPRDKFFLVAVEKEPPYLSAVYSLPDADILLGHDENERGLETYRTCLKTGIWPGYPTQEVGLSERARSFKLQQLTH